jgi:hypothetical protein
MIEFFKKIEKKILVFVMVFFAIYSYLTIQPVNMGEPQNATSLHGKLDRHVLRVIRFAKPIAEKPFNESKNHLLYHDRNPGMFKFIAEIGYRLNWDMPYDLQVLMIFLGIIGIYFQFYWVKLYFDNPIITGVSLLFLITTPFQTNFGITTHQQPYDFFFFNLCLFSFVRYLKFHDKKSWWIAIFSYFLLCQNYYMFYVSTFLIILGMSYIAKKELKKNFIAFALVPVLSIFLLSVQVINQFGGAEVAYQKMKSILMHRLIDEKRDEVVQDAPKKMHKKDWIGYPLTVSKRVERYYFLPLPFFLLMLFFIRRWSLKRGVWSQQYQILKFLIPAGLSWYLIMFQHTSVHVDSGRYSYFLWMLILAFFIYELVQSELSVLKKRVILGLLLVIYGGYGFSYLHFYRSATYFKNFIEFKQNIKNAELDNHLPLYDILSNEFYTELKESKLLVKNIKALTIKGEICPGLFVLDYLFAEKATYIVLKATKNMSKVYYLGIEKNNKREYFTIDYPNLQPKMWKKRRYFVIKFPYQAHPAEINQQFFVAKKNKDII